MQKIFENKGLKNFLTLVLPVIIGLLSTFLGSKSEGNMPWYYIKLLILVAVIIIFIIFVIFSYRYDKKSSKEKEDIIRELEIIREEQGHKDKDLKIYKDSQIALAAIFQQSAENINNMAENIFTNRDVQLDCWSFKEECKWICEKVLQIIENMSGNDEKFAVSIFQRDPIRKRKQRAITMIAHSSRYGNVPDVFETPLTNRKNKGFYAVKLFEKSKHEPTILIDKNEVNEKFIYKDENNHPNYSQYVAIPIHCSGNDMISLLQIVAFEDSKIGDTKVDITTKINQFIYPYTQLGLMAYKYEKALLNSGYIIDGYKQMVKEETDE